MITWADLGLSVLALFGTGLTLFGLMMVFAGGMSSAPSRGKDMGKKGCSRTIVGLAVTGFAFASLFGWLS